METTSNNKLSDNELKILQLASLAPSGHNAQPWFVQYIGKNHWIVGNDKSRWLPAVDPDQRETILSIGAFCQNLEFSANQFGFDCKFTTLAVSSQDEHVVEVKLIPTDCARAFDIMKIKKRRMLHANFIDKPLSGEDVSDLVDGDSNFIKYFPKSSSAYQWLNKNTIEAYKLQTYRDDAQAELANWIRFPLKEAESKKDGLTLAGMGIKGLTSWILSHFYTKENVMKENFRGQTIKSIKRQVAHSAGWILISSKENNVNALLDAGRRLQRLLLKVRERNIGVHPMTQILEEKSIGKNLNFETGLSDQVQFILRVGYVKHYPEPVSLRREVADFVRYE